MRHTYIYTVICPESVIGSRANYLVRKILKPPMSQSYTISRRHLRFWRGRVVSPGNHNSNDIFSQIMVVRRDATRRAVPRKLTFPTCNTITEEPLFLHPLVHHSWTRFALTCNSEYILHFARKLPSKTT